MDEPLASLDGPRRQMVMTTLFADKAFKQIFLITHTEVQQEGAHVITLTQESKDVRNVECSFGSA
jgi:ABC-type transport system involved in cytochrome bd biosynthesis fused ATPase/permease subunit